MSIEAMPTAAVTAMPPRRAYPSAASDEEEACLAPYLTLMKMEAK